MQAVNVSPLKICVHKFPFIDDWRNKFRIDRIQGNSVRRLLPSSGIPDDVYQIAFMSKNGLPETSTYIEGSGYCLRSLFEMWYSSLQIDITVSLPERWNDWKRMQFHPSIHRNLSGVQVYRDGRGRRSYFCAKHLDVNPNYRRVIGKDRDYSDIKLWAKDGSSPLRFHGLKTDMFSLASCVLDEIDKLDAIVSKDIPF